MKLLKSDYQAYSVAAAIVLILLFQNCGQGGFESVPHTDAGPLNSGLTNSNPVPPVVPPLTSQPTPTPSPTPPPTSSPSPYASIDEVIAAMPKNSWKELPGTKMEDVCPRPLNSYACWSVIGAWSGGALDLKRMRMVIHGGGHADSWYNNIFSFDILSLKWERLSEMPAGASQSAPAHWNDHRVETCGYYPKGPVTIPPDFMVGNYVDPKKCFLEPLASQLDLQQPRSSHTYGEFFVDPLNDRYCAMAGGTYPSSQASTPFIRCWDPNTKTWTRMADKPHAVGQRGQTSVDSKGHIWAVPAEGGYVAQYQPPTNQWVTYGYSNYETGGGSDIDRNRNHLYVMYTGNQPGPHYTLRRLDLNSSTSLEAKPVYTNLSPAGDMPTQVVPSPGFTFAEDKDQFYFWAGGKDVYTLDPVSITWKKWQPAGDDPGPQQINGTYGRFRYVPSKGIVVLVNDTRKNVFIYKPGN